MTHFSLEEIDTEISRLLTIRKQILSERFEDMRSRAQMLSDIIVKAATLTHPNDTASYIQHFVMPWRHFIPEDHFPATFDMLNQPFMHLPTLAAALRQDRETLDECVRVLESS